MRPGRLGYGSGKISHCGLEPGPANGAREKF